MKRPWLPTALLAAAIVIAVVIGSLTISSVVSSQRELISVKGLAQVEFGSDVIVWNGQFERKAKELNTDPCYDKLLDSIGLDYIYCRYSS